MEISVVKTFGVARNYFDRCAAGDADVVAAALERGSVRVMPIGCGLFKSRFAPADQLLPRGDVRLHSVHPRDRWFVTAAAAKAATWGIVDSATSPLVMTGLVPGRRFF